MELTNEQEQKKRKTMLIAEGIALALMIIGLIILGYFTYRFYAPKPGATTSPVATPRPSASKSSSPSASSCASTLTSTDKNNIGLWKTYTNSKYNYSFKYPQTWVAGDGSSNDEVILKDNEIIATFYFKAATLSIAGDYTLSKEEDVTVACVDTVKKSYSGNEPGGEDSRIMSTKFTKNGQEFDVELRYTDRGASIMGDIIEAYDLILKTVEFR
ncbi:MAG: PsbP-related protein [Candidatus Berkelbacteria bacterium]|nr:PsbP-related protein [Candidatus Berkelbacteria bacterium]